MSNKSKKRKSEDYKREIEDAPPSFMLIDNPSTSTNSQMEAEMLRFTKARKTTSSQVNQENNHVVQMPARENNQKKMT